MGRIGPLMQQHAAEIYNIISGGAVPERKPLLGGEPAGTEPGGAR